MGIFLRLKCPDVVSEVPILLSKGKVLVDSHGLFAPGIADHPYEHCHKNSEYGQDDTEHSQTDIDPYPPETLKNLADS